MERADRAYCLNADLTRVLTECGVENVVDVGAHTGGFGRRLARVVRGGAETYQREHSQDHLNQVVSRLVSGLGQAGSPGQRQFVVRSIGVSLAD